jgi:hypothetical protein
MQAHLLKAGARVTFGKRERTTASRVLWSRRDLPPYEAGGASQASQFSVGCITDMSAFSF